jgi:hypothetical protein
MKGDQIPPNHYVARHCRYIDLVWHAGRAVAVTETAFRLRPDESDGLSVDWVDFFQGNDRLHKLACIRSITKLQVKDSHRIALLQVQDLAQAAAPAALTFVEDPDDTLPPKHNAAHALIKPVADLADLALRQKLASRVKPMDLHTYKP